MYFLRLLSFFTLRPRSRKLATINSLSQRASSQQFLSLIVEAQNIIILDETTSDKMQVKFLCSHEFCWSKQGTHWRFAAAKIPPSIGQGNLLFVDCKEWLFWEFFHLPQDAFIQMLRQHCGCQLTWLSINMCVYFSMSQGAAVQIDTILVHGV